MQIVGLLPGVVGAIDGTHINIFAPSINENIYVNRKWYYSTNTQVVFDADYNIFGCGTQMAWVYTWRADIEWKWPEAAVWKVLCATGVSSNRR